MLHAHGGLVDDEPRTDVGDFFQLHQSVGLERVAGIHQIDDAIGQTRQRRQFHGAIQLDHFGLHALSGIESAGNFHVFGGDAVAFLSFVHTIGRGGNGHAAAGNAQIQHFVEAATLKLHDHVLAHHADIRRAELHISGHVGRADHHQLHFVAAGVEYQLARFRRIIQRRDARGFQQRQGFFQYAALGQGNGQCHVSESCG